MFYYSEISNSIVSEPEAMKQIIDICGKWYEIARPKVGFDQYLKRHSELLEIANWPYFKRSEQQ